ncbi:gamma-glutamyltransferase [Chromatiales bacterium (ex Bugula neritina AB1)]|nr:gamma-glutamyltransferase [Chromatiales bacterium (ex Bugula neritina AB1)]
MFRFIATALLSAIAASSTHAESTQSVQAGTPRQPVIAENYMVAAANPFAVNAGVDVLANGGTAADAAVTVQTMLNLFEPQSSGIGGGAFMLYWDASEKKLITYDGREKAPASATPEYFFGEDNKPVKWWDAVVGGRSVGVPGTLKLLEKVHGQHGKQAWSDLLLPAIVNAEAGFEISPRLAASIASAQKRKLDLFPATRDYFFNEDGSPKEAGTYLKNPLFAQTLRNIAANGSAPFYQGDIAAQIVEAVKTEVNPGELTLQDMADYEVIERAPVCFAYRAYDVCGMGPPTSGGLTMGQILTMLEQHDLPAMGPSADAWHLYIEAAKLAYADRGLYMADSDFVDMPDGLLNKSYLSERAALIDPEKAMGKATAGNPPQKSAMRFAPDTQLERAGTSHFSIVDQYGDMISMTTTIETGFGSRVMTNGFLLNNELTDFSRVPEKDGLPIANRVEGGKRPRSSMSPTIVFKDQQPVLAIGSPGGSRIINYVTQSVIAILDWNMDPQTAVDFPHVVNRNGNTDLEENTTATELEPALAALGHEINIRGLNSGLHAILVSDGKLIGAADSRREGIAAGH